MQFQHSDTVFTYLAPETKCSSKNSVEEKFTQTDKLSLHISAYKTDIKVIWEALHKLSYIL